MWKNWWVGTYLRKSLHREKKVLLPPWAPAGILSGRGIIESNTKNYTKKKLSYNFQHYI